jgi:hypothetical protein
VVVVVVHILEVEEMVLLTQQVVIIMEPVLELEEEVVMAMEVMDQEQVAIHMQDKEDLTAAAPVDSLLRRILEEEEEVVLLEMVQKIHCHLEQEAMVVLAHLSYTLRFHPKIIIL